MYAGVSDASLNAIVSNLVKKVTTEVILKNGNFQGLKYCR